jgi:hypothetical protein
MRLSERAASSPVTTRSPTVQYPCPRSALGDETLRARSPLPERIPPNTYRVRLDAGQIDVFDMPPAFTACPGGNSRVALVP